MSEIQLDPGDIIITKNGRYIIKDDGEIVKDEPKYETKSDSWRQKEPLL